VPLLYSHAQLSSPTGISLIVQLHPPRLRRFISSSSFLLVTFFVSFRFEGFISFSCFSGFFVSLELHSSLYRSVHIRNLLSVLARIALSRWFVPLEPLSFAINENPTCGWDARRIVIEKTRLRSRVPRKKVSQKWEKCLSLSSRTARMQHKPINHVENVSRECRVKVYVLYQASPHSIFERVSQRKRGQSISWGGFLLGRQVSMVGEIESK